LIKSKNSEKKITNHLQQDVIKLSGKTIFINPFLYWRRFDENTNRWLREPGQMSEDQISPNRNRFYPEIEWADLSHEQKLIKDATVEMFLKTLELISTFHPDLSSGKLLEDNKLEELFECGKGHPIILKRFLGGDISLETFVIYDIIFSFSEKFDEKLLDPVWETVSLKIRKYKPFLNINVFNFKKILREIVNE